MDTDGGAGTAPGRRAALVPGVAALAALLAALVATAAGARTAGGVLGAVAVLICAARLTRWYVHREIRWTRATLETDRRTDADVDQALAAVRAGRPAFERFYTARSREGLEAGVLAGLAGRAGWIDPDEPQDLRAVKDLGASRTVGALAVSMLVETASLARYGGAGPGQLEADLAVMMTLPQVRGDVLLSCWNATVLSSAAPRPSAQGHAKRHSMSLKRRHDCRIAVHAMRVPYMR